MAWMTSDPRQIATHHGAAQAGHHGQPRARRDGTHAARAFRRCAFRRKRLRQHGPAHRLRPDDQPALHRRPTSPRHSKSDPTMRVLEIGTGSGYQAAMLRPLCRRGLHDRATRPLLRRGRSALQGAEPAQYGAPGMATVLPAGRNRRRSTGSCCPPRCPKCPKS